MPSSGNIVKLHFNPIKDAKAFSWQHLHLQIVTPALFAPKLNG